MNSNENPEAIRSGRIESSDDVEGHAFRAAALPEDDTTDDVEGHAVRVKAAPAEDGDDDVEGHGVRVRI